MARHPSIQHTDGFDSSPSSSQQPQAKPKIPQFQPLPPTNVLNRLINALLAPLFYLLFTIVISIIVVPVYTVIEQIKHGSSGRGKRGGEKIARDRSGELINEPAGRNRVTEFLNGYGGSYGVEKRR